MSLIYKHYGKSYDTQCDHNCRRELLCNLKSARSEDSHACDTIPPVE